MILSPKPHVTAPPSLAEVLRAAEEGTGLIGRLEIVDTVPTTEVPEDKVVAPTEDVVDDLREALDAYHIAADAEPAPVAPVVEVVEPSTAEEIARARSTYVAQSLDDIVPALLEEIAELERCVRRTADEADRAARHLDNARRMVAKVIKAADASQGSAVLRLAVPGQRASIELPETTTKDDDGPSSSRGRW